MGKAAKFGRRTGFLSVRRFGLKFDDATGFFDCARKWPALVLIVEWSVIIVPSGSASSYFTMTHAAICLSVGTSYNTACRERPAYSGMSMIKRKGHIFVRPMK